jgi:hypothetical protein
LPARTAAMRASPAASAAAPPCHSPWRLSKVRRANARV